MVRPAKLDPATRPGTRSEAAPGVPVRHQKQQKPLISSEQRQHICHGKLTLCKLIFAALLVASCIACSSLYLHLVHQLLVPLYNSIPLQASWKGWAFATFVLAAAITIPDDIGSWGTSYVVPLAALLVADVTALFGRDLGSWYTVSLGAGPGAARIQIWLLATVMGPLTAFGAYSLVSCVITT